VINNSVFAFVISAFLIPFLVSCSTRTFGQSAAGSRLVELLPFELDPRNPEQKEFGRLTLLSAYQLRSKDSRFGGLSGSAVGADGRLYWVSDQGYWVSARMNLDAEGHLTDLTDWDIQPLLSTTGVPVRDPLYDAEALARAADGSFLVSFEKAHRIWRYPPPPVNSQSLPTPVPTPAEIAQAPPNGGLESTTVLPDGRILTITEELQNPDGSFKGWLIDKDRFAELSYLPSAGFQASDCAALRNGDVIVVERRYVPFGILSARLKLIESKNIHPGGKLVGEELLRLESPLWVDNFEGVAVQEHPTKGTILYLVSDDNYNPFQQTLLLQFRLNRAAD
jgi:hypothetical protein